MEIRSSSSPLKAKDLTACLELGPAPRKEAIEWVAKAVPLMDKRGLPNGEPWWTCRVYVKEMLYLLWNKGYSKLPPGVTATGRCQVKLWVQIKTND